MQSFTIGGRAKHALQIANNTYAVTVSDGARLELLSDLSDRINSLVDIVYGYTSIADPLLNIDDEIINWTLPDVADDFANSVWNLASGFYKAAASSLRNGYEMCAVSLTFQIEENLNPRPGEYCSKLFAEWDRGDAGTPNWKTIKGRLRQRKLFAEFDANEGCDMIDEFYSHYKELCAFTHGRPFSKATREPTNTTNIATDGFDPQYFKRLAGLIADTIAMSASMWVLAFPEIHTHQETYAARTDPTRVLVSGRPRQILDFVTRRHHAT